MSLDKRQDAGQAMNRVCDVRESQPGGLRQAPLYDRRGSRPVFDVRRQRSGASAIAEAPEYALAYLRGIEAGSALGYSCMIGPFG